MKSIALILLTLLPFGIFGQTPEFDPHPAKDTIATRKAFDKLMVDINAKRGKFENLADALPGKDTILKLDLKYKVLLEIPKEVFEFKNLEELDLSHNNITKLPKKLKKLKKLKKIYISHNAISNINVLFKLKNIEVFRADDNKLGGLSPKIIKWKKLNELVYSGLSTIPDNLWKMHNLKTLRLWNGTLTALPAGVGNLTNLTTLCVRGNQIDNLPKELFELKNLSYLSLISNKFTQLPVGVETLPAINYLGIGLNPIATFNLDLAKIRSLQMLACFDTRADAIYWENLAKRYPTINFVFDSSKIH